jgi:hypothetical protein
MSSHSVPGFKPTTHGLHFPNIFPSAPVITVTLPGLGAFGFGDASGGLCGGMVFTVRDLYEAGVQPPPCAEPPAADSPLFKYLCRRLLASFHLPLGVLRYYEWMCHRDSDDPFGHGPAARTLAEGWPAVRQAIDGGHPAPLGLVTVHSFNPRDLGKCHQVLAFAYELDEAADSLSIAVYDPNLPDRDDLRLVLAANEPGPIAYSGDLPVRGFFLTSYSASDPRAALAAP